MFDAFLHERASRTGEAFVPFDATVDYNECVDGKPRYDGVRSFLASRGIELPEGRIRALGDRKNKLVLELIAEEGVDPYEGSVRYVRAAREAGLRCAVVSSSTNAVNVLDASGIAKLFDVVVDGVVQRRDGLRGKPAPDSFVAAARSLGVAADEAAVFEDALAGVEAGRAGGFAYVVGVDRADQAEALREHGADIVVSDLAELLA
jgi:HAD superfamily hydrolase (TIGR01509 family)